MLCGSGIGACVAANKLKGIRAGVSHDTYSAHQGVEHDDMNVLCLGARVISRKRALECLDIWLDEKFLGGRYKTRNNSIRRLEQSVACKK